LRALRQLVDDYFITVSAGFGEQQQIIKIVVG
jgi:hypothetical protein